MNFEFATAGRIVFGPGTAARAGELASGLGRRSFVVTGRHPDRARGVLEALRAAGLAVGVHPVAGEPTVAAVSAAAAAARHFAADLVVGYGGGGALDAAKAVAAMLTNPGDPLDYLEVVGRGQPLPRPAAPTIAIPTTAGTGAEVTRNAVLGVPERGVKASLRHASLLPRVALVDPELTLALPSPLTASTGLDALTQLIEPYTSSRANPLTDAFCAEGLPRVARSLRRACTAPGDLAARTDLALASLCGGLALANAGLGAAHGFAAPIGGRFPAPHGAVCAVLLAPVMAANLAALRARAPDHPALARYATVARWLTGDPSASADDGVFWVRHLVRDLGIPPLRAYGIDKAHANALVTDAARASSMKANPLPLHEEELHSVLAAAL
jgi:alcohol dehydrogenase class IV